MTIISVEDLTKRYGDRTVLDGVSFSVRQGEIFGLLGPNGAGKTTTVECLEGMRTPDAGTVRVLGLDPARQTRRLRRSVGIQLQESQLQDALRVGEALELYASFHPRPRDTGELLEQWGLAGQRRTRFGRLSGGQKQRLFIALALVGDPEVVFLDELTTGLDPQGRRETWDLVRDVRDSGVTVVLVSHLMDEVTALCDRAAVLDGGRIVAEGTPADLVAATGTPVTVSFRPTAPLDLDLLAALPSVERVVSTGGTVEVSGAGPVVDEVTATLARGGIVVAGLRIRERTLDDAYVRITGGDA
ncbi:ABC transporter ATP-binding protein [Streptomyces sp. SL13]|uniref:ABC-type xenobiotic transporter n=1 Tax=Streptantibioticus silvisoli TaxID=2705255 RepID=A0AA90H3D4_9ACTN|nr:ABC transporter ATP-binding protein [Streptantibioticus silvisoli]MDI5961814.1 ABC transporter ATP-binding protein [Streptantibioticus silvisoli]MDI5973368.1 ABC transporter ATP-binding protein [Streptantibioticus silvisoli]